MPAAGGGSALGTSRATRFASPGRAAAWASKAAALAGALAFARRHGIGGDAAPLYLDIGARGGLPRTWRLAARLGMVSTAFVEPDPAEAARLARAHPGATVIPHALGAGPETRVLHLTRSRGSSSLLRPDYDALGVYGRGAEWQVERTVPVKVVRLDAVWSRHAERPPDYVKIDVQGFESEVLEGMGALLDRVLCLEFETVFLPLYVGQPTFQEMFDRLHRRGFDLVKIRPLGLYRSAIVEFNALMVRRDRHDDRLVRFWKRMNDVGDHRRIVSRGF